MTTNIILAFHEGNSDLALTLAKLINELGSNKDRRAYFIATAATRNTSLISSELSKGFGRVTEVKMGHQYLDPACRTNEQFFSVAIAMAQQDRPWLYLEPECVPLCREWIDKLEREYVRGGRPTMGREFQQQDTEDGVRILRRVHGNAIYAYNLIAGSPLVHNLGKYTAAYAHSGVSPQVYDRYVAGEMSKLNQSTDMIGYYPSTAAYKRKGNDITFATADTEIASVLRHFHPAMTIERENVLACGCIDGSLHRIIGNEDAPIENVKASKPPLKRDSLGRVKTKPARKRHDQFLQRHRTTKSKS